MKRVFPPVPLWRYRRQPGEVKRTRTVGWSTQSVRILIVPTVMALEQSGVLRKTITSLVSWRLPPMTRHVPRALPKHMTDWTISPIPSALNRPAPTCSVGVSYLGSRRESLCSRPLSRSMTILKDGTTVWISPIQVMQSAAGWYLGHSCLTLEYPPDTSVPPELLWQPYDRQTGYMTKSDAEAQLARWLKYTDSEE